MNLKIYVFPVFLTFFFFFWGGRSHIYFCSSCHFMQTWWPDYWLWSGFWFCHGISCIIVHGFLVSLIIGNDQIWLQWWCMITVVMQEQAGYGDGGVCLLISLLLQFVVQSRMIERKKEQCAVQSCKSWWHF